MLKDSDYNNVSVDGNLDSLESENKKWIATDSQIKFLNELISKKDFSKMTYEQALIVIYILKFLPKK